MSNILKVKYTISDYDQWRTVFKETINMRAEGGLHSPVVLRNMDNPLEITILHQVSDLEKAREFIDTSRTRDAIVKAGVTNIPDFTFLSVD